MSLDGNLDRPLAWITGASGLIGSTLLRIAGNQCGAGWRVRGLTRADLDLEDASAVRRRLSDERPSLILHCAAMSRTPACEADPSMARRVNVDVTLRLAEGVENGYFVFYSSDLVFNGLRGYYHEADVPSPVNVYGRTKVAAEEGLRGHPGALVIRTSLNYGHSSTGDRAFNEEVVRSWRTKRSVKMLVDEFRCPIPVEETARGTWDLVEGRRTGIVHLAGSERLSRWQIAQAIADHYSHLDPQIEPVSLKDFVGPPRAPDVSLDCTRVTQWLGRSLPAFTAWLSEHEPIPGRG